MLRLRDTLLLAFAGAACWAMATSSPGCNDSFALGGGGSVGSGGFGGTTQGMGGINYATCDECLDPTSGAPVHQCADEFAACDADPDCVALLACTEGGVDVTSGGAGGTTSTGGLGGAGGTTASGSGGASAGGASAGGGGATAGGGGTTTNPATGAGGASSHGQCDTSFLGACCMLDCAVALHTPEASKTLFLQRTRCLDCATCKTQCTVADAFCAALQDGSDDCSQ